MGTHLFQIGGWHDLAGRIGRLHVVFGSSHAFAGACVDAETGHYGTDQRQHGQYDAQY